jgi:hypothetical protein
MLKQVTLSFTPYTLLQWYLQSNEVLLNLSMKCWNSAFDAQGSRLIIVVVQIGAVENIYVAAVEALEKKKRQDETQFTTKIGGKTSLGPSYFIFIPSSVFDALLCWNWPFLPPNCVTLQITLLSRKNSWIRNRYNLTNHDKNPIPFPTSHNTYKNNNTLHTGPNFWSFKTWPDGCNRTW